jgi:L-histidine Nalpha-methyltransferase
MKASTAVTTVRPVLESPSNEARNAHDASALELTRFRTAVLSGLGESQKTLPCKYFYDARGARLFEQICELEEYYPTRTELAIMRDHGREMAATLGPRARVVELGSGEGLKTRLLLEALDRPVEYLPVDISGEQLSHVARSLRAQFPRVRITPVVADYTHTFALPSIAPAVAARTVAYFAGSTIGNFEPDEALAFLSRTAALCGPGGGLLLGVDLKKDKAVLDAAYNDRDGVTAAFNMNLLARINRELGGDFREDAFRHKALYNEELGRIEMHLFATRAHRVRVGTATFGFERGESIVTEYSYKYDIEQMAALAARAGFAHERVWLDAGRRFSVHAFTVTTAVQRRDQSFSPQRA